VKGGTPISTSYVERQNLTMRMGMRRFTRLTNAFFTKVDNQSLTVTGSDGKTISGHRRWRQARSITSGP
jgi:hypothetical protein